MSVKQAILDFTEGEIRNRIFVTPDIPVKKLTAARSQFVTRDDEVIVLYDDTVFGSGKDGIAITENYIYAKQLWEIPKSIKISSIRSITSQSKALNNLEIYINNNLFITVSTLDKADHEFLVGILKAAKDAAATTKKKTERAAPAEQTPSPARSVPKAKPRSAAKEEALSCDECSAVLPSGAKFCLECGTKVLPKGVCLECNAKLPEKARFCPECGTPAGKALAKPAEPKVDTAALRADLASWLSSAAQDASIDNDGDLNVGLNATAPAFAKDFRGWVAQYDLKISSEGVTEETSDSSFYGRDDEFYIRSPYCRVGRLASASYEMAIKLQVYTLQELEIHEVVLKDGALSIPKLGSSQVKIKSLSARRDDDGSYGVEYELDAYPNHVVHFEVLTEKPEADAAISAQVEEESTRSGTNWLWDVEPGRRVYVCFGEYKPLVDGIEASFSDTAKPVGGSSDNNCDDEYLESNGATNRESDFKINAGWERRDDSAICRWIIVWQELADNHLAGAIGGYSGGGSFQVEQFYAKQFDGRLANLLIDIEDRITGASIDYWEDVPPEIRRISDDAQDVIFEWNDRDEWEDSDHLVLLKDRIRALREEEDMLLLSSSYTPFAKDILASVGITAGPVGQGGGQLTSGSDHNDEASLSSALQQLAERTEISLTASSRLARYFRDCDNLFTSIGIEHGPGSLLKVSIVVETDGQADDLEEAEEAIGDYIFDAFLTPGLIEIFGEEGYEGLEFENHFKVKSLEDSNDSRGDHPTDYPLDQLLSDPSVQETLQAVEDKLLERGTLLSLLSGDDPEVSINFEFINPYNMDKNSLFIVINVSDEDTDPDDIDDDDAEAVGDFVYSKISEMSGGFSKKSKEEFQGIEGTIVRVNGIFKG